MKKVKDINIEDHLIDTILRIERVIVSTGSSGNNYLILHLADSTGRIEARKWVVSEKDKQLLKPNTIVLLKDTIVHEYRNILQLKVEDYQVIDEKDLLKYNLNKTDLYITAPLDIKTSYLELISLLNSINNQTYKTITLNLIEKYKKEFLTFPAAMSIHHNVTSGLFWHSYTLVKNVLNLKENYFYANIDWDLLICGAILHDIGKVIEISDVNGSDYSLEGKLLGHISIGNAEINKLADKLNLYKDQNNKINKEITLLQHMILASHGKKEFGSPIEPVLIEAVILSALDDLDAKVYKINDELSKIEIDNWTQKITSIDNKMFYKHKK
ncbi:3'-5' exoribonuclease YhaM family protein [Mycoplasma mycoides]|uniref:3'-5' exoribonuclease YhaM family protein n=1 Tax=Mycoplasma mycoides TaxID=2102 RepID=UPI0001793F17|nr:HD domain-containing protein [Mycoplasma mycoides]ADH21626.1 cmp-binding-factor [synthetic Mycoplasma mycoides JCVI-syn1.0]AMW76512.1 YhaM:putative 3'-5' exoribonuclease [synthetic bacterium JCVI-Syn3.0]AMW76976.1 YhaM:putative 3'-5' exoribonuclease [synthetic bacterium JCVI-Syn2.0]AVX54798.1 Putative 3'-5' exoribonuclease [synthetic bacterium JCVI-Syn3A]QWN46037.1 HD domain-containing protein [synthetic bacterium JCVI-Syn3B]